ncbi:hypothetical protein WBJ53_18205 [Spirosoma sp. SC4-14]|uniref:hypothetical protein n=1 Tax=Spirosoma sp. SC4-14 TaxID=3128900 RepID=UPI0030CDFD98
MNNFFVVFMFMLLFGCSREDKDSSYIELAGKYNILHLQPTDYRYNTHRIYQIDIPKANNFSAFSSSNYLVEEGGVLMEIFLTKNCEEEYLKQSYKIISNASQVNYNSFNRCDITLKPLLDWNLNVGDTLYYYTDHFVVLNRKMYDPELHEYVFEFYRKWRNTCLTSILATHEKGIIGLYDLCPENGAYTVIKNAIGKSYHSKWRFLDKKQLRQPDVNLNKVGIFTKDD